MSLANLAEDQCALAVPPSAALLAENHRTHTPHCAICMCRARAWLLRRMQRAGASLVGDWECGSKDGGEEALQLALPRRQPLCVFAVIADVLRGRAAAIRHNHFVPVVADELCTAAPAKNHGGMVSSAWVWPCTSVLRLHPGKPVRKNTGIDRQCMHVRCAARHVRRADAPRPKDCRLGNRQSKVPHRRQSAYACIWRARPQPLCTCERTSWLPCGWISDVDAAIPVWPHSSMRRAGIASMQGPTTTATGLGESSRVHHSARTLPGRATHEIHMPGPRPTMASIHACAAFKRASARAVGDQPKQHSPERRVASLGAGAAPLT